MATAPASLEVRSARSMLRFVVAVAVALFAAAGTFDYWQAWVYVAMQAVAINATNAYLLKNDRELLRRRLAAEERGEKERVQKLFILLLSVLGVGMLVVAGLDHRFRWSAVPLPAVLGACIAFGAGNVIVFLVFRQNTFGSSVIEVDAQQAVVDSGMYGLVRHPMYTGMLLAIAATPLALGSYYTEIFLLPLFGLFVMRLLAEERLLRSELPGYAAYMDRTRKRLVPGVW